MNGKLNAAFLRQLEEDASALLGEHYGKLVAQRTRGLDQSILGRTRTAWLMRSAA